MHIPDGYMSPQTAGAMYALMAPVWYLAAKKVKQTLDARRVPYLAIGAAFSFVVMMFNVPIPGGSTGHAVGGTLVAILLGPWAAVIAITVALVIQALIFGDGGITAIGANCFNIAFILPFTGYFFYKLIAGNSGGKRRIAGAFIGSFIGINAAALCTGIEFGIQPILHHTADGQALYCPYGFKTAVSVMMAEHLLIFGWIEAVVTALVVAYLQKADSTLLAGPEVNR